MVEIDRDTREVSRDPAGSPRYSICTLVTDRNEYAEMVESFLRAGFDRETCEYLHIDNSAGNRFDAYRGVNRFLRLARGEFVILCHQDVRLRHDDRDGLERCIAEVGRRDESWAVLGNAGGVAPGVRAVSITDPEGERKSKVLPRKVGSLDENFLLVRADRNLALSGDLDGFHLYGTDLCQIARILGYGCWVVDFHLVHESIGTVGADFADLRERFIRKYRRALGGRHVQTTCTRFYVSGSRLGTRLMNTRLASSLVRKLNKLRHRRELS